MSRPTMTDSVTHTDAIGAALRQDWKEAIRINEVLLKKNKTDVESLCRLGFAYLKSGQLTAAKDTYQKVIKYDQYNQIALKNLQKLTTIKKKNLEETIGTNMSPLVFLEEPGKTKLVDCINVAPIDVLSTLSAGQELELTPKKHSMEVRTLGKTYVGALPDDLSFKLNKLIEAGNTYQVVIKSVDKKSVRVIVREMSRGKKFAHQPSFIATSSYVPFTRGSANPNVDMPDVTPTGEEDEERPQEEEE